MSDQPRFSAPSESILALPGVLCVGPPPADHGDNGAGATSGRSVVRTGAAAGWMAPAGIHAWERELSFVARADLTVELARAVRATMPHEQIAPKRFPMASRAVEVSPLLPITSDLVDDVRSQGVRVHTVGVDRVSSDFYYFAEGGPSKPVHVQGNLVEMLAPSLVASSTNDDIRRLMEGLLDRVLVVLSDGVVSELEVELADALPRLSRNGTGLAGTDLEAFDAGAQALVDHSARFESSARLLAEALSEATRLGRRTARVPLYGEAKDDPRPSLELLLGGATLRLPEAPRWTVAGAPREEKEAAPRVVAAAVAAKPAPAPQPEKVEESPPGAVAVIAPMPVVSVRTEPREPAAAPIAAEARADAAEASAAAESAPLREAEPRDAEVASAKARPRTEAAESPRGERAPKKASASTSTRAPSSRRPAAARGKARANERATAEKSKAKQKAQPKAQPRPSPSPARQEARASLAIFVLGLLALAGAIAYSGWRWWHVHHFRGNAVGLELRAAPTTPEA